MHKNSKVVHKNHMEPNEFKLNGESINNNAFKHQIINNLIEVKKKYLEEAEIKIMINTGEPKILVKNGIWQVPVEERPKEWEKLGVKEKE